MKKRIFIITIACGLCLTFTACRSNTQYQAQNQINHNLSSAPQDTNEDIVETTEEKTTSFSQSQTSETEREIQNQEYAIGLDEVHVITSNFYYYFDKPMTDSFGYKHNDYHVFHTGSNKAYSIFNLNGEYSSFSGSWVVEEDDNSIVEYFAEIYLDGKSVYKSDGIKITTGQVDFNLDVSGCSQMEIRMNYGGYSDFGGLYLVNTELM